MIVAFGCDHGGFSLKEPVLSAIRSSGHSPLDFGTDNPDPIDYPDIAIRVGTAIQQGKASRGIIICGSGVGACIASNKINGLYAGVCHDTYSAHQGVEHDDMNVLCIGARVIGEELAKEVVLAFLSARFIGNDPGEERHARRVGKVRDLEKKP
jgi:ribose 5-phosphate isomerase B